MLLEECSSLVVEVMIFIITFIYIIKYEWAKTVFIYVYINISPVNVIVLVHCINVSQLQVVFAAYLKPCNKNADNNHSIHYPLSLLKI